MRLGNLHALGSSLCVPVGARRESIPRVRLSRSALLAPVYRSAKDLVDGGEPLV